MKQFCLAAGLLAGLSTIAGAAPITCAPGVNISNTAQTVCALNDLTFTFNAPTFSPTSVGDFLTIDTVSATAAEDDILFAINPGTTGFPVDVNIDYSVTSTLANIVGVDAEFPGGTQGSIFETVCSVKPTPGVPCPAANLVGSLTLTTAGVEKFSPAFSGVSTIYVHKDIDAVSFSEFTDGVQLAETPEPSTYMLLGFALLVLGCRKLSS